MKISSMGNRENFIINNDKIGKVGNEAKDFSKALNKVNQVEYKKDLQRLIEEVDKMAKKLAQTCTLNDLKKYKQAVKKFLKRTIGEAYQAHDETGWNGLGRQKQYILIRKIDENLEDLSHQVLQEQKDSLNILKKLDEIRGILVDMYL